MSDRFEIPPIVTAFIGLLKSDPSPTDLDIAILDVDNQLDSSDPFVKVDQHVGIDASNLPTLVRQFRSHYMNLRKDRLAIHKDTFQFHNDLMDATSCLLCLCPDNSTAWGDRSRCLLFYLDTLDNKPAVQGPCRQYAVSRRDSFSLLQEELKFLNFLFTRHSNKPSPWSYRKWICKKYLEILRMQSKTLLDFLNLFLPWTESEMDSMVPVVEGYPKNYYAWSHKIFIVQILLQNFKELMNKIKNPMCMDVDETAIQRHQQQIWHFLQHQVKWSTEEWLPMHVSDHSAVHYGATVLQLLVNFSIEVNDPSNTTQRQKSNDSITSMFVSCSVAIDTIQSERRKIANLIVQYPKHESLWLYRRYCCLIFLSVVAKMMSENMECHGSSCSLIRNTSVTDTNKHHSTTQNRVADILNQHIRDEVTFVRTFDKDFYAMTFSHWLYFHLLRWKLLSFLHLDILQSLEELKKVFRDNIRLSDDNHSNMWMYFSTI